MEELGLISSCKVQTSFNTSYGDESIAKQICKRVSIQRNIKIATYN